MNLSNDADAHQQNNAALQIVNVQYIIPTENIPNSAGDLNFATWMDVPVANVSRSVEGTNGNNVLMADDNIGNRALVRMIVDQNAYEIEELSDDPVELNPDAFIAYDESANDDPNSENDANAIEAVLEVLEENAAETEQEDNVSVIAVEDTPNSEDDVVVVVEEVPATTPPLQAKKRKRTSGLGSPKSNTPKLGKKKNSTDNTEESDEDDGLICPVCLDFWEMSGPHRLVSLRCGHLFGDSCIRRWLVESYKQTGIKTCPQCKKKAKNSDIRFIYAKRVRAVDRTEEHELRQKLEEETKRRNELLADLGTIKATQVSLNAKIKSLENDNDQLRQMLRFGGRSAMTSQGQYLKNEDDPKILSHLKNYKLYLDRCVDISREPGCRVMACAQKQSQLLISQKSPQSLFPGYGLRFVDTQTLRPMNFLHTSTKMLRDICLSNDHQLVSYASMESRTKIYDIRAPQVLTVLTTECDKPLWSCAMGLGDRTNRLYLGAQHGTTFVYDLRDPRNTLDEYVTPGDLSPVVSIAAVSSNEIFAKGGVLVCKLQSIWFYEYAGDGDIVTPARLDIEGPFISMCYDDCNGTLLISARSNSRCISSRFIFGSLNKIDGTPVFEPRTTVYGSKVTPVMTRSTQIAVEANTLISTYIQDTKQLAIFDVRRGQRKQCLPVQDLVYDMCPIYSKSDTFLAALTECRCRIYKLATHD